MEKSYYAIIPASVRYDPDLCANAKLLYGEITALCNENGYCWASNDYFAKLYDVSKISISKWVGQLLEKKYIISKIQYKEKAIIGRFLYLNTDTPLLKKSLIGIKEKFNTPIKEKFKDNNTIVNNTYEYSNKEIYKEKRPTLEEVKSYCKERNNKVDYEKWFNYYSANGWKVGKNSMKDWKAAVRTWEKNNYDKQEEAPLPTWFDKKIEEKKIEYTEEELKIRDAIIRGDYK